MPTLDAELRQVALDLIDELGKSVQFRSQAVVYDPTTGGLSEENEPIFYDIKGTPPGPRRLFLQTDDVLVRGNLYFYIAASGLQFTPYLGQIVKVDAQVFKVMSVDPFYSGEQVCIYGLEIHQ